MYKCSRESCCFGSSPFGTSRGITSHVESLIRRRGSKKTQIHSLLVFVCIRITGTLSTGGILFVQRERDSCKPARSFALNGANPPNLCIGRSLTVTVRFPLWRTATCSYVSSSRHESVSIVQSFLKPNSNTSHLHTWNNGGKGTHFYPKMFQVENVFCAGFIPG